MSKLIDNVSLAKEGIKLLLNNKFEEAEELFTSENGSVQMAAGYCFLTFINALMTFEEDKLEESLQILKDIEKKCSQNVGWLKSMRHKMFGSFSYNEQNVARKLEEQIILADSQVCVALLTFLQQDLTSYVRGGWVLRKAWKIYQHTYAEIFDIYKKTFGCDSSVPGSDFPSWQVITKSCSDSSLLSVSSTSSKEWLTQSTPSHNFNGFKNPLNYITSFAFPNNNNNNTDIVIEPQEIARLMAAVSFGYGIFQLCVSLLPSSLLRLIHFLGFEGDRKTGLSALMFSREGSDMRGPLASLALLWYHTIVRPYFALDGTNVQAGVDEAELLINESETDFGDSALYLYFKGRVQRLKSDIPMALKAYECAIDRSNQREIQLLCLHEIGWCYLIQLDWGNAFHCFDQLKSRSKWSKSFYTYLTAVCVGALGNSEFCYSLINEIPNLLNENTGGAQIEIFIKRRIEIIKEFEKKSDDFNENPSYIKLSCELLILELLYFWNALSSSNMSNLQKIIYDCQLHNIEPMIGLSNLVEGAVNLSVCDFEKAVEAFKKCVEKRNNIQTDAASNPDQNSDHLPAFAMFEWAAILIHNSETVEEGKKLLVKAQNDYKGYDFENRLNIRIHALLKKIT